MAHLLVPIDFSDCSLHAAVYAMNLSVPLKATVELLHVYHVPVLDPNMTPDMVEVLVQQSEATAHDQYILFKQKLDKYSRVDTYFTLRSGFAVSNITTYATECGADYIVMGTLGADGFKKLVGSNTANVIEHTQIPVIAVPEKAAFTDIRNILYASDLRFDDYKYIDQLVLLAKALHATITCLHITETGHPLNSQKLHELQRYFREEMHMEYLQFAELSSEDIYEGLTKYIDDNKVDMVAMLTRKRNLLERIFHKSMTRKMAYHTHIPLLAFHN